MFVQLGRGVPAGGAAAVTHCRRPWCSWLPFPGAQRGSRGAAGSRANCCPDAALQEQSAHRQQPWLEVLPAVGAQGAVAALSAKPALVGVVVWAHCPGLCLRADQYQDPW